MSPVPILLAFVAAMALFGVWVYCEVRESLRRDVARVRAAALEPLPLEPVRPIETAPEPATPPIPRPVWRRRAVAHAAGFAVGLLLLLTLALNGSRKVPVAHR